MYVTYLHENKGVFERTARCLIGINQSFVTFVSILFYGKGLNIFKRLKNMEKTEFFGGEKNAKKNNRYFCMYADGFHRGLTNDSDGTGK
jgi:hypothetical protein